MQRFIGTGQVDLDIRMTLAKGFQAGHQP
jgi:hypothetical protein